VAETHSVQAFLLEQQKTPELVYDALPVAADPNTDILAREVINLEFSYVSQT